MFDIHQHILIESQRMSNEQRALHCVIIKRGNHRFARKQQRTTKKEKNAVVACLLCFFFSH